MNHELFVSQTFGPLTQDRAITLLVSIVAAFIASCMRVWRERSVQRRSGLPLTPLADTVPDVVLGAMAGLCLALLANWIKPIDPETTWLFSMLGGAAGPKLLDIMLRFAAKSRGMDVPAGGAGDDDHAQK